MEGVELPGDVGEEVASRDRREMSDSGTTGRMEESTAEEEGVSRCETRKLRMSRPLSAQSTTYAEEENKESATVHLASFNSACTRTHRIRPKHPRSARPNLPG